MTNKCKYCVSEICECYEAKKDKKVTLICPNCERHVPNASFFIKNGCKWCIPNLNENK